MSLNINVLVTAREEYVSQLMNILIPYYKKNFKKIFENSQSNSYIKYKLRPFQEELRDIQRWNDVTIDNRVKELTSQYPYFSELLKAIFVINVKILSCVKTNPKGKGIKIEIPQIPIFIHKLFIEIARKLYYKPHMILASDEDIEYLIENAIHEILRNQIPIQQILQEYLMDTFDESDEETEEEESEHEEQPHVDEPKDINNEQEQQPLPQQPEENDHDFSSKNEQQNEKPNNEPEDEDYPNDNMGTGTDSLEGNANSQYRDLSPHQQIRPPPLEETRRHVLFEDAKTF